MTHASPETLPGFERFLVLDRDCQALCHEFLSWLQEPAGPALSAAQAAPLAHAADRYLRDFLVEFQETGPDDEDPDLALQYLANWYVIHTLEPSHAEIEQIRTALQLLYRFFAGRGVVGSDTAARVADALAAEEFFHQRLDQFWELTPDAIPDWRAVHDYRRRGPPPA